MNWLHRRISAEAESAIDELSPKARAMVLLDRKHTAAWGRLFDSIGHDRASELLEVSTVDSWARMLPGTVSGVVGRWADGNLHRSDALRYLNRMEHEATIIVDNADSRIPQQPVYEESRRVLGAAQKLIDNWFPTARAFVMNEPADDLAREAQAALTRLEHESDDFDAATVRLSLPLIGGPDHWDRSDVASSDDQDFSSGVLQGQRQQMLTGITGSWPDVDGYDHPYLFTPVLTWNPERGSWVDGSIEATLVASIGLLGLTRPQLDVTLRIEDEVVLDHTHYVWLTEHEAMNDEPIYEIYARQWNNDTREVDHHRYWLSPPSRQAVAPIKAYDNENSMDDWGPQTEEALSGHPVLAPPTIDPRKD